MIGRNAEGNEREREEGGEEGLGWMVAWRVREEGELEWIG